MCGQDHGASITKIFVTKKRETTPKLTTKRGNTRSFTAKGK
jgi:hypothetical protein